MHETLLKYHEQFLGTSPGRVLVPLCGAACSPARGVRALSRLAAGKTHDLAWLATQGGATEVVGVEFVQQALEDCAKEHAELKLKKCASFLPL